MSRCRENRKRRAKAAVKLKKWRRKNAFKKLGMLGGDFIREQMQRPSMMSMLFKPMPIEKDGQLVMETASKKEGWEALF